MSTIEHAPYLDFDETGTLNVFGIAVALNVFGVDTEFNAPDRRIRLKTFTEPGEPNHQVTGRWIAYLRNDHGFNVTYAQCEPELPAGTLGLSKIAEIEIDGLTDGIVDLMADRRERITAVWAIRHNFGDER